MNAARSVSVTFTDNSPVINLLKVVPKKVRRGRVAKIEVSLSESAGTQFQIERLGKASKVGRFNKQLLVGTSTTRIPGKILKSLKPGAHRIEAVATDSAGQASESVKSRFRVVRTAKQ